MNQDYQRIEQLLARRIGLGPDKLSPRQLIKAVTIRQKACGFNNVSDYLKRLDSSAHEFQELVEQMQLQIEQAKVHVADKEPVRAILLEMGKEGQYRIYGEDSIGGFVKLARHPRTGGDHAHQKEQRYH